MELDSRAVRVTPFRQVITFTTAQWQELERMREHYHQWGDHLSRHELGRLDFVRWLYQTGRVEP